MLDVGCGAGDLAARLATRIEHVDALDRDPGMISAARARVPGNVTCVLADVMHDPLPANSYDAIVSLSALHHLPLRPALRRLADALRPGGVLVVVALPRTDLPRDLPVEAAGVGWHLIIGAVLRLTSQRWPPCLTRRRRHSAMPVRDPVLTTRQVREVASTVLPGVRVRRLLLWRYLLVWEASEDVTAHR